LSCPLLSLSSPLLSSPLFSSSSFSDVTVLVVFCSLGSVWRRHSPVRRALHTSHTPISLYLCSRIQIQIQIQIQITPFCTLFCDTTGTFCIGYVMCAHLLLHVFG